MYFTIILFFIVFYHNFKNYFWEREREHGRGRGRERGRQKIGSGLCADSREPNAGLKLMNYEIMTWAEVRHLTDWATQVPRTLYSQYVYIYNIYNIYNTYNIYIIYILFCNLYPPMWGSNSWPQDQELQALLTEQVSRPQTVYFIYFIF